MKSSFIISLLITVSLNPLFAQSELSSSDILKFAQTFEILDNKLIGKGGETILKEISESQFFLLGEQHLPKFWQKKK